MAENLPLGKEYATRREAMEAMKLANLLSTGHEIQVDKEASGKRRVVLFCASLFTLPTGQNKGRKICILHSDDQLAGFVCEHATGETDRAYAKRRLSEAEAFAWTKGFCGFKAVLNSTRAAAIAGAENDGGGSTNTRKYIWKWKIMDNGKNYYAHAASCTSIGVARGALLQKVMRPKIAANRNMPGKKVADAVTGVGSVITRAQLPSQSAMYRNQYKIKHEDLKWYTLNWGRLEIYCNKLREMNPTWTVTLEKDDQNRFERLFVGIGSNLKVLEHAGLDVYALDSCHVKHVIAKNMQLHILVSSQGGNRNVILAFSVDKTESGDSYTFFGKQCVAFGIKDLFDVDREFVPSRPVLFSDGMKGILEAIKVWGDSVHHAACARHLAGAARDSLKRQRIAAQAHNQALTEGEQRKEVPSVILADPQLYNLCRAPTEREFREQLNGLARSNQHAALYLRDKDRGQYSQATMMGMNVHCHGRITSQAVEGTNGVLVEVRKEDPYTMVYTIIQYAAGLFDKHEKESQKWKGDGKVLTPYASKLFASQRTLAMANHAYTVLALGSKQYKVQDSLSAGHVAHTVCIDKDRPSCNPCNFFNQHGIPCCHMMLCIGMHEPNLLNERKKEFFEKYFNPSFLVKNLCLAYEDGAFNIPNTPKGPPLPKIISLNSDSEDEDADEDKEEGLMLPPVGFALDDYKKMAKRGRPRLKRIRSRGAVGDDGARLRKRSVGLRRGRNSAEEGRNALAAFSLD